MILLRRSLLSLLAFVAGGMAGLLCAVVLVWAALLVGRGIAVEDDALKPWARPFEDGFVFIAAYALPIGLTVLGAIAGGLIGWRRASPSNSSAADAPP